MMWSKGPCDVCGRWRWSSRWRVRDGVRVCHRHDQENDNE